MKRFIRYLYEYEQGKKTRNVGFVKVEQDDYECTVHVHGKGLRMNGEKLELYLFYEENGVCMGIPQGEVDNINPAVNCRLYYTREDVGEAENFSKINGVIMSNGSGRKYASVWDDMEADVEHMRVWTASPERVEPEMQETEKEEPEREEAETQELKGEEPEREEAEMQEFEAEEPETEEAEMQEFEGEEPEIQEYGREEPETEESESGWMETDRRQEESGEAGNYRRMSARDRRKVTKIQRKELARLPRCEWRLANNNFLLHGYYNYHHLVFIENRQMMYLGVPGIYHEKEAQAAAAFGFPDFVPVKELDVSLTADECEEQEEFGYWCRQVRHPFY